MAQELERMRQELAATPPEVVIANHCYGLFELAAVYLSQAPPMLAPAALAIDAMGAVVDGLGDRLGEHSQQLAEGLSQLRMAYVQIDNARRAGSAAADAARPNGTPGEPPGDAPEAPPTTGTDQATGDGPSA